MELQVFNNFDLKLKVRTIQNEDGSISINAEDAAKGFGWIQTQNKNGKQYTSIRWETVNDYCKEIGFPNKLGKDDYIPESLFYMLGMKASNKIAQEFQRWLAIDVIPQVRKTGSYQVPQLPMSKELKAIFMLDEKQEKLEGKVQGVEKKVDNLESNMPLFNIDCEELQRAVRKIGLKVLGGKSSNAYRDKSIRTKVYSDIQHQIKREFGLNSYKAIKRSQLDIAKEIIEKYQVPLVLNDEITCLNNQIEICGGKM